MSCKRVTLGGASPHNTQHMPNKPDISIVTTAIGAIHAQCVDQIGHLHQTGALSDRQVLLLDDIMLHVSALVAWQRYCIDAFQMRAKRGSELLEQPPIPFRIRIGGVAPP